MAGTLGEFDRIDRFFKPLSKGCPGALGLSDDAGLLTVPPGRELVVTTDAMVESVHYLAGEPASRLARKLLRVNLSDLAAMGARPIAYTLTTALPAQLGPAWLADLAEGLAADQDLFGLHLLGGDSVSTPGPPLLSVTAFGEVEAGRSLKRSGACIGDRIFVSGTLGDGALGLLAARGDLPRLGSDHREALAARYHLPTPRLDLGRRLVGLATAAMDVSDGLSGDLAHICRASAVGARIRADHVPMSDAALAAIAVDPALHPVALAGGDDYELLFTVPPSAVPAVATVSRALDLPLTNIGEIVAGSETEILDKDGKLLNLKGWEHY
ncbi:MAG: thiamine-phosphate kinase [Inquilinaceae bacterium]